MGGSFTQYSDRLTHYHHAILTFHITSCENNFNHPNNIFVLVLEAESDSRFIAVVETRTKQKPPQLFAVVETPATPAPGDSRVETLLLELPASLFYPNIAHNTSNSSQNTTVSIYQTAIDSWQEYHEEDREAFPFDISPTTSPHTPPKMCLPLFLATQPTKPPSPTAKSSTLPVGVLEHTWSVRRWSTPPPYTSIDNRRRATTMAYVDMEKLNDRLAEAERSVRDCDSDSEENYGYFYGYEPPHIMRRKAEKARRLQAEATGAIPRIPRDNKKKLSLSVTDVTKTAIKFTRPALTETEISLPPETPSPPTLPSLSRPTLPSPVTAATALPEIVIPSEIVLTPMVEECYRGYLEAVRRLPENQPGYQSADSDAESTVRRP